MRILKLTPAVENKLAQMREGRDRQASAMASKIVCDVRRRGDTALFHWTRKFDRVDLAERRFDALAHGESCPFRV